MGRREGLDVLVDLMQNGEPFPTRLMAIGYLQKATRQTFGYRPYGRNNAAVAAQWKKFIDQNYK